MRADPDGSIFDAPRPWQDEYPIDVTDECDADARYAEEEVENWLASWSDDFNSDEWLEALAASLTLLTPSTRETHPSRNTTR